VAVLKKLSENGEIDRDETVVCYVTGSGLKTLEILSDQAYSYPPVEPRLQALTHIIGREGGRW